MPILPVEIIQMILAHLPAHTIKDLSNSCQNLKAILEDNYFWKNKYLLEYDSPEKTPYNWNLLYNINRFYSKIIITDTEKIFYIRGGNICQALPPNKGDFIIYNAQVNDTLKEVKNDEFYIYGKCINKHIIPNDISETPVNPFIHLVSQGHNVIALTRSGKLYSKNLYSFDNILDGKFKDIHVYSNQTLFLTEKNIVIGRSVNINIEDWFIENPINVICNNRTIDLAILFDSGRIGFLYEDMHSFTIDPPNGEHFIKILSHYKLFYALTDQGNLYRFSRDRKEISLIRENILFFTLHTSLDTYNKIITNEYAYTDVINDDTGKYIDLIVITNNGTIEYLRSNSWLILISNIAPDSQISVCKGILCGSLRNNIYFSLHLEDYV